MGLFNKNDAVVKEVAKKEKEKKKLAKGNEAKNVAKGKQLTSWLYQPIVAIILFSVVLFASLEFVFVQEAERQQAQKISATVTSGLVRNARRFMDERESLTEGLAVSDLVKTALVDSEMAANLEATLKIMYPDMDALFLISTPELVDPRRYHPTLTFANIDAVRRASGGEEIKLDAFLDESRWLLQSSAPVKDSVSGDLLGVVLVIHDTSILTNNFVLPASISSGLVALKNSKEPNAKSIVAIGAGNIEAADVVAIPGSKWSVSFALGDTGFERIDRVILALCVACFALLSVFSVLIISRSKLAKIRGDLIAVTQSLQAVLSGDGKKSADIYYSEVHALFSSLSRTIREKAKESLKQSASSTAAAAQKQAPDTSPSDAPLFDDDLLDLDVLSESSDRREEDASSLENDTVAMVEEVQQLDIDVPQSIFRAYDIRGVVDDTLTEELVELIGRAFASEALAQGQSAVCVGYDGRLSSETYCEAMVRGIVSAGLDAKVVGCVPTPVLYFATHHLNTGTGVMITGSHNPSNYNGLKMMIAGNTLSGESIQKLYNRIVMQDFAEGQGARSQEPVDRDYMDAILNDIAVAAPLKVVVDAGNGVTGELGPALIEELGCEVIPLFCEIDGNFPNHHPDPGKPGNLEDLMAAVKEHEADIGIAFDGDGDRLGVVTNSGKIIWPDRLLMLFAKDVVSRNPGADIIFDVKCSRRLNGLISGYGGRPIMWKTGHSLIKAKMKETGALLAGEMSGHIFFKERWFGFDDGLYSAARLLEILGVEDSSADDVFASFPEDVSTPEINIEVTEESKFMIVEKLCQLKGNFTDGNASTIDGLRVDYPDSWGLCRASNTTPMLVLRFEADDEKALEEIKDKFKAQLAVVEPSLNLNF